MEYKLVIGTKEGKCVQKELKSPEADVLHNKIIGDVVKGDGLGLDGYEFQITGGSDKCGFPMRKGIQDARKRILVGGSVGFCGKKRRFGKKKVRKSQKGLLRKRTVCGERVSKIIRQVNVKVVKAGKGPLTAPEAAPVEAPAEESK